MRLSKNFTLEEFTRTDTGLPNEPIGDNLERLYLIAVSLQLLRNSLDTPIHITSGYRSPQVNEVVGGVPGSLHTTGQAVDFTVEKDPYDVVIAFLLDTGLRKNELMLYPEHYHMEVSHHRFVWCPKTQIITPAMLEELRLTKKVPS